MQVKITICDDSAEEITRLSCALLAYDPSFVITAYPSGTELIGALQDSAFAADILFLDIFMPGINGIQAAQAVRDRNRDIKIIFLSCSREHYPQAYDVFAFNYIEKPFDREKLYRVLGRAIDELSREQSRKMNFTFKSAAYSVDCRNILFLESQNKLIQIHLADGSALQRYGKLDEMARELPEHCFIRCHQSYLVNIDHITEMGDNCLHVGPVMIGISKRFLKPAKEQYYTYLFNQLGRGQSR